MCQQFISCFAFVSKTTGFCLENYHVLEQGDLLYKSPNIYDIISADEFPRSVNIIRIEYLQLETKIATITDDDPFLQSIVPLNNGTLFLLFMGSYATALIIHIGLILIAEMKCCMWKVSIT